MRVSVTTVAGVSVWTPPLKSKTTVTTGQGSETPTLNQGSIGRHFMEEGKEGGRDRGREG